MSERIKARQEPVQTGPQKNKLQNNLTELASLFRRKWNPVIIYQLLESGPLGFSSLEDEIDEISNKILSECLADLEDANVIERSVISERPFRVEYALMSRSHPAVQIIQAVENGDIDIPQKND